MLHLKEPELEVFKELMRQSNSK